MKKIVVLILLTLCLTNYVEAQKTLSENPFRFVMNEPEGWFPIDKGEIEKNLERWELRDNSLEKFLSQSQGKVLLFAYVRFRQDSFTGLNPKIEARVVQISTQRPLTFAQFKPAGMAALRRIASQFDGQRYIVEPSEIKIAGIDSVYHISEFEMSTLYNAKHKVRSRTYLIPRGTYFFQISFVDEPDRNDCAAEFDELVKSIKILR